MRTDMYCTECSKQFVGEIDESIDGNHIIICPHCGHEHCRVVEKGKITEARWSSRYSNQETRKRGLWVSDSLPMRTSAAAQFLRDRWLNLEEE